MAREIRGHRLVVLTQRSGNMEHPPMSRSRLGPGTKDVVKSLRAALVTTAAYVDGTDTDFLGFNKVAIALTMLTGAVAGGIEMKVEWSDDDTDYFYESQLKTSGVFQLDQQRIYAFKGAGSATTYYTIFLIDVLAPFMRPSFKSDQGGNFATLTAEAWGVRA